MDVEGLGLIDESAAISGHLDNGPLGDLPHGLVERFDVSRDVRNILDRAAIGNDAVLHIVAPEAHIDEVFQKPWVDDLELAGEYTTRVDVRGVRFETFIVAEDLAGGGGGHGSDEKRVTDAMFGNGLLERGPVPQFCRCYVPHVVLKNTLGDRRAFVGGIWSKLACDLARCCEGCMVDSLEDLLIQVLRFRRVEG